MSAERRFQTELYQAADAGPARASAVVRCSLCGKKEHIVSTGRSPMPPEAVQKKLMQSGWLIGRRPADDTCPKCIRKAKENKVVTLKPKPEPVREISRDDRRIIFAKIEDVYEGDGYIAGWTDKRVAEDLGVPKKWVSDMRAEFFGDAAANEEILQFLERVETFEKKWRDAERMIAAIQADAEKLRRDADAIRKAVT